MSKRTSIVKALAEKLTTIDGSGDFLTDLAGNAYSYLKFWDEVIDFPCLYMTNGTEIREYHPSGIIWGYLNVTLKIYTKGEDSSQILENVFVDVENIINSNRELVYDDAGNSTTDILLTSITTDEGLLAPYAIGEISLQIRYLV